MKTVIFSSEDTFCAVCGSLSYKSFLRNVKELYIGYENRFNIVECEKCGHRYTNPRPIETDIVKFYPDESGYYIPQMGKIKFSSHFIRFLSEEMGYPQFDITNKNPLYFLIRPLLRHKAKVMHIPQFISGGKVLDIGCSWGGYLLMLQKLKWQVYGVELNENATNNAKKILNTNTVYNSRIEDAGFETEMFSVVNMSMVIEHLYDPRTVLEKVFSLLKKNGKLICSIPVSDGFELKLHKEKAYTLHVPQHLQHFTKKSITRLLNEVGFSQIQIINQSFDRDFVAPFAYKSSKLLYKILRNKIVRNFFVRIFITAASWFGKTSRITVVAIKKEEIS